MRKKTFYTSVKEQTVTDYELNLVFLWNIKYKLQEA